MSKNTEIKFPGRITLHLPVISKKGGQSEIIFDFPLGILPTLDDVVALVDEANDRLLADEFDAVVGESDGEMLRTFTLDEFIKAVEIQEKLVSEQTPINHDLLKGVPQ